MRTSGSRNTQSPTKGGRHTVSIMEFRNGKVVHEKQYFADPLRGAGMAEAMGSADRVTQH
jgi:hypothetical protein